MSGRNGRGPRTLDQRRQDVAELVALLAGFDTTTTALVLDRIFAGRDGLLDAALNTARAAAAGPTLAQRRARQIALDYGWRPPQDRARRQEPA